MTTPKSVQLQGGFVPWPPDQGLCPWTPLGAQPPDPHYRLALRERHMAPQSLLLDPPLSRASNLRPSSRKSNALTIYTTRPHIPAVSSHNGGSRFQFWLHNLTLHIQFPTGEFICRGCRNFAFLKTLASTIRSKWWKLSGNPDWRISSNIKRGLQSSTRPSWTKINGEMWMRVCLTASSPRKRTYGDTEPRSLQVGCLSCQQQFQRIEGSRTHWPQSVSWPHSPPSSTPVYTSRVHGRRFTLPVTLRPVLTGSAPSTWPGDTNVTLNTSCVHGRTKWHPPYGLSRRPDP